MVVFYLGCGGGGGGGGGLNPLAPTQTTTRITGTITAPDNISTNIATGVSPSILAAAGIANAEVYLESNPSIRAVTDSTGKFELSNVPVGQYRIIAKYQRAGITYKTRSNEVAISTSNPIGQVGNLLVVAATNQLRGVLKDSQGNPIINAQLTLWGETFRTNALGEYESPMMPAGVQATIVILATGYQQTTVDTTFNSPLPLVFRTTMVKTSETNRPPVIAVQNVVYKTTARGMVNLSASAVDPDKHTMTYLWTASLGQLATPTDGLSVVWTAPDQNGVATITFTARDSQGLVSQIDTPITVEGGNNDTTPPAVAAVVPSAGLTNVATTAIMVMTFTEPMDMRTLIPANITLASGETAIAGAISISSDAKIATFTPSSPLPFSTTLTGKITRGVKDLSGNSMAEEYSWVFTTAAPGVDRTAPVILAVLPSAGSINVATSTLVTVTFNEAMDVSTLNASTITLASGSSGIAGTMTLGADGAVATFTPTAPLSFGTVYTVTVKTAVKDLIGNAMLATYTGAFTTSTGPDLTPPTVLTVSPASGAINIPVTTAVVFTFSEIMDAATLDATTVLLASGNESISGALAISGSKKAVTFTPTAPLEYKMAYRPTITTGVKDVAGNALVATFVREFMTASDTTAPTLVALSPASGAVNVSIAATIQLTFSEPLDPTTLDTTNITVAVGGVDIAGTLAVNASNTIATFTPGAPLSYAATYTVTVKTAVTDRVGNSFVANDIRTFATAETPDTTPPTVASIVPADTAVGVAVNAVVVYTFNEAMDPTTLNSTNLVLNAAGTPFPGTLAISGDNKIATFTPAYPLAYNVSYTPIVKTGVKDAAGNALAAQVTQTFSTTLDVFAPTVATMVPVVGATNIATNTRITLLFSEPMDATTLAAPNIALAQGATNIPGAIALNASNTVATFTPSAPLDFNTVYTMTVTDAVKDANNNNMAANFTGNFTTSASVDSVPPTVVSVTPGAGAVDIATTSAVVIVFSEAMNPLTLTAFNIQLLSGGTGFGLSGQMAISGDKKTVTFTPYMPLAHGTTHTVRVSTAVQDTSGNPLNTTFTQSFTTKVKDVTPPTVAKLGDGILDFSLGAGVIADLVFSEAISASGKTAVQNAITAGASAAPGYSWSAGDTILTIAGAAGTGSSWDDDVVGNPVDLEGNVATNLLLIDSSGDTVPPAVVAKLGNNTVDFSLAVGVTGNIVFSEALDAAGKLAVENAITTARSGGAPGYSWNVANTTLTVTGGTGGTSWANDVTATVTDLAGNSATGLLLIDSSSDETPPTVAKLGNGTIDYVLPYGGSVNLVFSEALSAAGKTAVQNAITAGATNAPAYGWSSDNTTLTLIGALGNSTFADDVTANVADLAGNISVGLLLIDSSGDVTPPTVTKLGDGSYDYSLAHNVTANLIFNEELSSAGKTAVQNALTAEAVNPPAYSWNVNNTMLTLTGASGGTAFPEDVTAHVSDVAGNIAFNLLLIDSSSDVTPPTVTKLGDGNSDYVIADGVSVALIFNEALSGAGKTAVQSALTAGKTGGIPGYAWNGANSILTITGGAGNTVFPDDVFASFSDAAGNVANNLKLIDSSEDNTPPSVAALGNGITDYVLPAGVTATLVFSEAISAAGKLAVQNALDADPGTNPSVYSWNVANTILTLTGGAGGSTFVNDVTTNVSDMAGNSVSLLLIDSSADETAPTVTKLGNDTVDYSLGAAVTATLVFNEALSASGKTAVQTAISAGTSRPPAFSWNVANTILTLTGATGGTVFSNDVHADVSDLAGNIAVNLLLIDSSADVTPPTVTKLGDGTIDFSLGAGLTGTLVFSEALSAGGQTAVETALTAGRSGGNPGYTWLTASTLQITGGTGGTSFPNDVSANLTDVAGNTSINQLLIDSSSDETPPTVLNKLGNGFIDFAVAQGISAQLQFSEPLGAAGRAAVEAALNVDPGTNPTYSWNAGNDILTLTGGVGGSTFQNDVLANLTDVAGNTSINQLLVDSSSDDTPPTVTKLGDGVTNYVLPQGNVANLTFSEALSTAAKTEVRSRITAGVTGGTPGYSWNAGNNVLTLTGGTGGSRFFNDVTADVTDLAGNTDNLLLIDSTGDNTPPTVTKLGDGAIDVTIANGVMVNLTFSEALSAAGMTAVQNALNAGKTGGNPTYNWVAATTLQITGGTGDTTFPNDVLADVSDVAGNVSPNLLLVDSTADGVPPTVTKLGDGIADYSLGAGIAVNLVFSEPISTNGAHTGNRTVIESAINTGRTGGNPVLAWNVPGNTLTITGGTGGTQFPNDITCNISDVAGNTSINQLLIDSSSDTDSPTVTKLGDGTTDVIIAQGATADLIFNEALSATGKTNVTTALTSGATAAPGYSWNAANTILTMTGATGGTRFNNDVTANVIDLAGNTATNLLLIDSSADETAPNRISAVLGNGTVDYYLAPGATAIIQFDEPLGVLGKNTVQTALTSKASGIPTYSWSGGDTILTITGAAGGGTTFIEDVSSDLIDVAGNVRSGVALINSSEDVTPPTVTKLGVGTVDFRILDGSSANLIFNEAIGTAGRSLVETALTNGAYNPLSNLPIYSWNAGFNTLTITAPVGSLTFRDDVRSNVSDVAGNTALDLLLVDSSPDETPPTVTKLGVDTVDFALAQGATAQLVFSEAVHPSSKTVITAAILAGRSGGDPLQTWNVANTILTITGGTGGTSWANDITADVADVAENVSTGLLLIDSSADTLAPTVTMLGNGIVDFTIAQGATANLVFSEALSVTGKSNVQSALTAGANNAPTYSWNAGNSTLTITGGIGGTTFANDVSATVYDVANNSAVLQLIDSSPDETAPSVTKLGTGIVDYVLADGVQANLVFSETVSVTSRTAVEAAITAGASVAPSYSWNGAFSTLTLTGGAGGSTFANDVTANVADAAGNSANLLLIDSSGDSAPPTISVLNPADNAINVIVTPNPSLIITFNEPVYKGTSGLITLKRASDNATFDSVDVSDARVSISGSQATINLLGTYQSACGYYVQIANTSFKDVADNFFAGIADTTTWNFTSADNQGPAVVSFNPADNGTGVVVNSNLVINFNENVAKGTGNITIWRTIGDVLVETIDVTSIRVNVSGTQVTIDPVNNFLGATGYYIQIAETCFKDVTNNPYLGILDKTTWNFTSVDTVAPTVVALTPNDGGTGVGINDNLVMTFNENVAKGSAGNIIIKRTTDNTVFEAIPITDSRISCSGSQVTINPTAAMVNSTGYYVQIDNTCIKDLSDNFYVGISDTTTWNFTTAAP
jgi:methionine-rich copper-binding protein CopC